MRMRRTRRPGAVAADAAAEVLEDRSLLAAAQPETAFVPGELLVQYKPGVTEAQQQAVRRLTSGVLLEKVQTRVMQVSGGGPLERLRLGAGITVERAVQLLKNNPRVQFAEPNWIVRTAVESDDPYYADGGRLWGMYSDDTPVAAGPGGTTNAFGTQAEKAWNDGFTGSASVVVGIIDEGLQTTHPDLQDNVWVNPFDPVDGRDNDGNGYVDDVHGWDFLNNDRTVYDAGQDAHGTHVAGTLGGQGGNTTGVAGVSWDVTLISTKFLGPKGGTVANAVKALDYLTDLKKRHGINIVAANNSWGGGGYSQALHDAIIRAAKQDILFVAAAGNSTANNDSRAFYPAGYSTIKGTSTQTAASYESVIAVAAITRTGALASYSNYGRTTVDLGAPGSDIWSTVPTSSYATYNGTSMATPHVTGAVALAAAARPGSSASALRTAILGSAAPTAALNGKTVSGGRLNVHGAIQQLLRGVDVLVAAPTTTEAGAETAFTVRLASRPAADVTLAVSSSDLTEGTVDVGSLTFTPADWFVPQTVTVRGVDDAEPDGDMAYTIVLGALSSADPIYNGLKPADVRLTNLDNDPLVTRFFVVDDGSTDRTFEYAVNGRPVESYALTSRNSASRGAASTAAGDRIWVVDRNRTVYVYDAGGALLGSWTAGSLSLLASVEGIATNGTDIWIVDAQADRVYFYRNAASRLSGTQTAASSFTLNAGNRSPKDLVTDGVHLWVVNDSTTDQVFRYSLAGALVNSWTIDPANKLPTGLTLDPSGASADMWIVDSGTDRVYRYADARLAVNGERRTAASSFALAAGNTNPQGLADPPITAAARSGRLPGAAPLTVAAAATYREPTRSVLHPPSRLSRSQLPAVGGTVVGSLLSEISQPKVVLPAVSGLGGTAQTLLRSLLSRGLRSASGPPQLPGRLAAGGGAAAAGGTAAVESPDVESESLDGLLSDPVLWPL